MPSVSATEPDSPEDAARRKFASRVIPGACAVLLAFHFGLRFSNATMKDGLDAIALGLAIVGLSPWIANAVKLVKLGGMEVQFQEMKQKVEKQGTEIDQLRFLIRNFVAKWELLHLQKLASGEIYLINNATASPSFEGELRVRPRTLHV